MWRTIVLVAGGLLWPLAPAALGCGEPAPGAANKVQSGAVKKSLMVEIKGRLVFARCMLFGGRTNVGIRIGDDTYWLDVRGSKYLQNQINEAHDQTVIVTGELETIAGATHAYIVNVAEIRPVGDDSPVRKTIRIEVRGKLEEDRTEILGRPYNASWFVAADGKRYYLHLKGNKDLAARVVQLEGRGVVATGTFEARGGLNMIHVNTLDVDPAAFRITFHRTAGIPDFVDTVDVTFDSTTLAAAKAANLRELIAAARFFELRSGKLPEGIPDPPSGWVVTLEMDGRRHQIHTYVGDMTPELQSLLNRLSELRTEQICQKLIGLETAEAEKRARAAGFRFRILSHDGVPLPHTDDLRNDRINVMVEKGKVVAAKIG